MIEKMTKYSWILLSGEKENFLESLRELGVVDITRSEKPVDSGSEKILAEIEEQKALKASIEKGSDATLVSLETALKDASSALSAVDPWGTYDKKALDALGLAVHYYLCPAKKFNPSWKETSALQTVLEKDGKVWFVVLGDSDIPLKELEAPAETVSEAAARVASASKAVEDYKKVLAGKVSEIPAIDERIASLQSDLSLYLAGIRGESAAEDYLVVYEGFAPSALDKSLEEEFGKMDLVCFQQAAKEEDNPPIKLRNGRLSSLFETITGMYGMPVYGEFDPTPILAIFFMLFFAMCMGDAGYGLVLILYGIAQEKKWVNIGMFDGLGKIISALGVATLVIGFFLGTFFGVSLYNAAWVPDAVKSLILPPDATVAGYPLQMVLALGIGVFHICLAMVVKTVCFVKRFGLRENLATLGWTLLVVGGVIVAAFALVGFLSPAATKWTVIGIAAVSALGIYLFNTPGRNPLANIGSGLWETYNMVTGLLGDVLSYIRLYALGLAGGMLGSSFNDIAGMVLGESPTWQWLPFAVIILFGHVLNLLMSCLGAFVHPLRLTFVEYFKNSGFEGRGVKYNPIKK